MRLTCLFIIEARFSKAGDDGFSKSFVNVFRRELKVTLIVTSAIVAGLAVVGAALVGLAVVGLVIAGAAVAGAAVVDAAGSGPSVKRFF